jgi:sphingosine kinase
MRWMGEMRFTVAAVYRLGIKKLYPGKLSMLLQSSSASPTPDLESQQIQLPPLSEPLDTTTGGPWKVIEDDFILVWVLQTSHCSSSMYSCPGASLDDGVLTIIVVRNMSRCSLLTLLLGIDNGDHMKHPDVEIYKAKAYRLEPQTDEGLYSLDGEVVEYGPIQGVVQPGAMRVYKLPTTDN